MDEDESAVSIKTEKTEPSNRRVIPSEVQVADMFANDGNLIFFQLPDVLPSLTVDKDRPEIKLEPGKSKEDKVEEPIQTEKEGVLNSLPEGKLGTLRIHQSGKVTMMLGDHLFELDSGTQVSFLQVSLAPHFSPVHCIEREIFYDAFQKLPFRLLTFANNGVDAMHE